MQSSSTLRKRRPNDAATRMPLVALIPQGVRSV